eukprot:TRINITY_DN114350_c0_g1_i1.p1 TRINITY_DN114350_c0_g1~~TRINITY_DN114350_c0_g1_i1.p1  ORF type:complete len:254 (+),score=71.00 TRINITY_DN114350_c0_g1_i1:46-807(+)
MDFDNESLLRCFLSEEEEKEIISWWQDEGSKEAAEKNWQKDDEGKPKRSDIFEWRLAEADRLRETGNELFKTGDYSDALKRYITAVWHLDFDIGQQWNLMEKHQLELNTRKLKAISNICAAYLKSCDWVQTKAAADIGLRHLEKAGLKDEDAEAKFYYRKGLANLERGFTEDAYQAFKQAKSLKPEDKAIRQAFLQASSGQKEDREKAKEVWRSKLLTDEEKACQGSWLNPDVFVARLRAKFRARCCRRRKNE